MTTTLTSKTFDSPMGELVIVGSNAGLRAILWPTERDGRISFDEDVEVGEHPVLDATIEQLGEYLAGDRHDFDVPLDLVGTEFQRDVWAGLTRIPYGSTQSYGELADELSKPGAARAVGAATGRNPISIIVPCHRLVGSSGKLTGFAGGIESKLWLLTHESGEAQLF
jgi:methylated-DNA-[protein]-cysteine S-methyltransferase